MATPADWTPGDRSCRRRCPPRTPTTGSTTSRRSSPTLRFADAPK
ncbi:MAG: hypothetical protein R2705_09470 [Ilumatobacteraceae bacterium]